MAWPVIGKSFTPAEFEAYVRGLEPDSVFAIGPRTSTIERCGV